MLPACFTMANRVVHLRNESDAGRECLYVVERCAVYVGSSLEVWLYR